jgi:N-acyl amino acid synthase of PEP-CTERM/exosortase system
MPDDVVDELGILNSFKQYFEIVRANTDELLEEVFKLRYQVYCLETGFENPLEHPDGLEKDADDEYSVHYLIKHLATQKYIATTRLILHDSGRQFPVEKHCEIESTEKLANLSFAQRAEISRFCISKDFKRRKGESGTLEGIDRDEIDRYTADERRTFPHLILGLFACLIDLSRSYNINYWYCAMEPALFRYLDSLGIHFNRMGPVVDYHGKRQPGGAFVEDILAGVLDKNIQIWNVFTNGGKYWGN